jgi:lysophospholipase L1-like esterase
MRRSPLPAAVLVGCLAAAAMTGCSGPGRAQSGDASQARPGPGRSGTPRPSAPPASYYLALGDSLSQGVQPDASGASVETPHGYPDQLYAVLRKGHPGLRLVKLGCPGETTATMIHGGMCRYRGGSQLAAAMRFLHAHRGRVALITIDIGANDADSCFAAQATMGKLASCVTTSIPQATANLTKILARLRRADPGGRIIAMSYYLPALAQWRDGLLGQAFTRIAALAAQGYNNLLARIYQKFGVRIANVFGAFHTTDFSGQVAVPGFGALPPNVAAICRWTWECAAPPRGPNQHANQAGYQVIAHTFLVADGAAVTS